MTVVPRLVVAAPASGHGKTTVSTGLLAAYKARGLRVSPHKVGPDYIDPGYHALASGRPGRNLDPYLVGPHLVGPLFAHGAAGADLAIVEGVMGLYDGAVGHGDLGSTAQVAAMLRAPVVLVVDASSQGRSVAALVHGFRTYEPSVWLGGVILNRVGSDRHEQILREACEEIGTPVFGALRRRDVISTPSRHLGLVPVAERSPEATEAVEAMGRIVAESVDLDRLLWLARSAPPVSADAWSPSDAVGGAVSERPVIAVASGAAFTFGYAETVELLEATGAVVARFDPLRDTKLPEGTAGLVVGGGFPEVHAEALAANEPLKKAVRELAASGAPIAAECAGLLWLTKSLDGKPMCGVLDAEAGMTPSLTLGYRSAVAISDSQLLPEGTRVHGHVFHRTQVEPRAGARPAWQWQGRPPEGFVQDGIHASYLHLHWAAHPGIARRLVDAAARLQRRATSPTVIDADPGTPQDEQEQARTTASTPAPGPKPALGPEPTPDPNSPTEAATPAADSVAQAASPAAEAANPPADAAGPVAVAASPEANALGPSAHAVAPAATSADAAASPAAASAEAGSAKVTPVEVAARPEAAGARPASESVVDGDTGIRTDADAVAARQRADADAAAAKARADADAAATAARERASAGSATAATPRQDADASAADGRAEGAGAHPAVEAPADPAVRADPAATPGRAQGAGAHPAVEAPAAPPAQAEAGAAAAAGRSGAAGAHPVDSASPAAGDRERENGDSDSLPRVSQGDGPGSAPDRDGS